jgi:hypothetical protein
MSFSVALNNSYEFTCELCTKLRSILLVGLVAVVAFTEAAGRARAANSLAQMGYHEEAKALMLGKEIDYKRK